MKLVVALFREKYVEGCTGEEGDGEKADDAEETKEEARKPFCSAMCVRNTRSFYQHPYVASTCAFLA